MTLVRRKSHKPRKLTLSPTKISTYLACRLMYKYTYIDKLSRFYYVPRASHTFGSVLHRALDEFHAKGGADVQSPEDLVESLHKTWASLGYASAEEEQDYLASAEQFLEQYHAQHRVEGARTLFTEKQLRCDMGDFVLMGRLDRLDEHPDGHLEVIDYKSGRTAVEEEEVRNDLAMGIYAYLVRACQTDKPVDATIYALRTGAKATVRFSDEDFAAIEEGVRAVAEEIARIDEDTVIEPVFLPNVCPSCDYLRLCARRAGWNLKAIEEGHFEA